MQPPQVNGIASDDADSLPIASTPLLPSAEVPLLQLCRDVNDRVELFLAQDAKSSRLRNVQEQTRIALGVIREALQKYTYVQLHIHWLS